jgi:hypothetical protein
MIFAVSFEIIIQRAVGNESCYPMKNTLIITVPIRVGTVIIKVFFHIFIHCLHSIEKFIHNYFLHFPN